MAAIDYIASVGRAEASTTPGGRRAALAEAWRRIGVHERELSARFLGGLAGIPGVELRGIGDVARVGHRTPTFALQKAGCSPEQLAERLVARGVLCASGNFYALGLTEALGLEGTGGVARVGFLHYNTPQDVDTVLGAIESA